MKLRIRLLPLCLWTMLGLGLPLLAGCDNGGSGGGGGGSATPAGGFGDNDPNLYLAYGDSITAGAGLTGPAYPERLSGLLGKTVLNYGAPGATSGQGVASLGSAIASTKPGYVLILFGANDIIMGGDPGTVADNVRAMIQIAKANHCVPVVATMTPMLKIYEFHNGTVSAANVLIRQVASAEGAALVDLQGEFDNNPDLFIYDGVHPNDQGAAIIALAFYDRLH